MNKRRRRVKKTKSPTRPRPNANNNYSSDSDDVNEDVVDYVHYGGYSKNINEKANYVSGNLQNFSALAISDSDDKRTITTSSSSSSVNIKMKKGGGKVSKLWDIMSLPDDVLYAILTFLTPSDLCKMSMVCRKFNFLSRKDCIWSQHAENIVLADFPLDRRKRHTCSYKEKCRLAPNWKDGKFKDRFITKHRIRHIPWIQKQEQDIWFSSGNAIRCFSGQPNSGHLKDNKSRCLQGLEHDVTRFVVKDNITVAASLDGSIRGWNSSGESLFHHKQVHQSDIHCVDCTDRCYISGSKDGYCKVTPLQLQDSKSKSSSTLCSRRFNAGERVWSLQSSQCQRFFVAGLAGCLNTPPLVMWDIESGDFLGHLKCNSKHGAGVLHMKFESVNELLTCGYDTFVRLWDLRTRTCVSQWEEPYDSTLYCLETDGGNAMAVGTAYHGMVRLWDKRKTEPVQMFYSTTCNSPVYSLAMDYGHLYLALDMGLSVMDFTR